ncbi:MAG: hypothetical protein ACUVRG_11325, partial [Ignavibacterium sp.]|uniref:hypothetical protein n=1 Tax=Ignavibacterium sp. TaxID=2651167 RepID=UPI004049B94F
PNSLKNAPLEYAPKNELGVVFLFAHIAKKLQLRIEEIRPQFPDCIAYRKIGDKEKKVRIEFEFKSSNFNSHNHNPKDCDMIVCWHHDWPDYPKNIEIVELKRYFGVHKKVWIQPVIKSQWHFLDEYDELDWGLSKRTTVGDLLLMYRCYPEKKISDIYFLTGDLTRAKAGWREGDCYAGTIKKICHLDAPIFLDDMRNHKIIRTSSFIRNNLQGNHLVSEYWPYLYTMIVERNPKVKKILKEYEPSKM